MHSKHFVKTVCLFFFVVAIVAPGSPMLAVNLVVRNALDIPRVNETVSVGLPFPMGWVNDQADLILMDEDGNPVTVQVYPEATWKDGSIMWALLDFPANVAAGDSSVYSFERGKARKYSSPLKVDSNNGVTEVITGPLKISLAEKSGPVIEGIWLDWNADSQFEEKEKLAASEESGLLNGTGTDTGEMFSELWGSRREVEIVEQGPQKVQILVTGNLAGKDGVGALDYLMRFYLYSGSAKNSRTTDSAKHEERRSGG